MTTITLNAVDVFRSVIELAIIGYLIYLSIYDIRYHKIRNNAVLLFIPVVMMKCTLRVCMGTLFEYVPMLFGAAAGFTILLVAAMITHGGIGGGDIKLSAVLGLAASLTGTLVSLVVASLAAAGYGMFQVYVQKKPKVSLAFVPFLLTGYVTALLTGFC